MGGGFSIKITVTKSENKNRSQKLCAAAWRPVWMQVGDVSLGEDEEFSNSFYFSFCMVGAVSFICYVKFALLVALVPV
uniref:Uncharacterized protein n=1 Tax=Solanum tuberosum TaxID=4113 RepID=M1DDH1_SOLTU